MISRDAIAKLRSKPEWRELEYHIREKIDALDTVDDIEGDEALIALEVKGRQRARQTLMMILRPFIDFHEAPDMTALAQERAEDAGL